MPEMRPGCRFLFSLAKVSLELICQGAYELPESWLAKLEQLKEAEPQCACGYSLHSRTTLASGSPAHRFPGAAIRRDRPLGHPRSPDRTVFRRLGLL
eukprot:3137435-Prymnesium_polylepis.1